MKFREHRGGIDESMRTCVDLADRAELVAHVERLLSPYCSDIDAKSLKVTPYARDERVGWLDTHVVTIDGYGVLGFTDGPPDNVATSQ